MKWLKQVITGGTLSDKMAIRTLLVQVCLLFLSQVHSFHSSLVRNNMMLELTYMMLIIIMMLEITDANISGVSIRTRL